MAFRDPGSVHRRPRAIRLAAAIRPPATSQMVSTNRSCTDLQIEATGAIDRDRRSGSNLLPASLLCQITLTRDPVPALPLWGCSSDSHCHRRRCSNETAFSVEVIGRQARRDLGLPAGCARYPHPAVPLGRRSVANRGSLRVGPATVQSVLTHMNHQIDYEHLRSTLPGAGVELSLTIPRSWCIEAVIASREPWGPCPARSLCESVTKR